MTVRDQMVGPWQVPVADAAVTAVSFEEFKGEAMAMGEKTPIAVSNAAAASRMGHRRSPDESGQRRRKPRPYYLVG